MARELQALADAVEQREGAAGAPPGGRDMTFEEKRRLSHALGALPGDRLGRVLDIICESQPVDEARRPPGPARRRRLTVAAARRRRRRQPCAHCCAAGLLSDVAWLMPARAGRWWRRAGVRRRGAPAAFGYPVSCQCSQCENARECGGVCRE